MSKEAISECKEHLHQLNRHITILQKLVDGHTQKKNKIITKLNKFIAKREKQLNLKAYKKNNNNPLSI